LGVLGALVLFTAVVGSLMAEVLAPNDPTAIELGFADSAPSDQFPLGTDQLGRGVLSRILFAVRVSLIIGVAVVGVRVVIGVILGTISGYMGGWIDHAIMRFTEMVWAMPTIVVSLLLVALLGPGLINLIIALGLFSWPDIARLVRSEVLTVRERAFVESSRLFGAGPLHVIAFHLIPNVVPSIIVSATLGVVSGVLGEASLSYLGLGLPSGTPSLGGMLRVAQNPLVISQRLWQWIPPGVVLSAIVLSINFVGDMLRDILHRS